MERLVLKDCMWFLEFFKGTCIEKLQVLSISLSDRLNLSQLNMLLENVIKFPSLVYLDVTLYLKEKLSNAGETCELIRKALTELKRMMNIYIKLPDLLIDDKQAMELFSLFRWNKYL